MDWIHSADKHFPHKGKIINGLKRDKKHGTLSPNLAILIFILRVWDNSFCSDARSSYRAYVYLQDNYCHTMISHDRGKSLTYRVRHVMY
jgi:hypothetical protein